MSSSTAPPSTTRASTADRSVVRIEASGSTPDMAMALLPGLYAGKDWHSHVTDKPFTFRYVAIGDEMLTLRRSQMQGFLRGSVPPGEHYVVQRLTRGRAVLDVRGTPVLLHPFRPTLLPPDDEFRFEATDHDQRQDLVLDVASEAAGTRVTSLRLDARITPSHESCGRWHDAVAAATAAVGQCEAEDLAWHTASRWVASALLGMYPLQGPPLPPALLFPRNWRVRAAVEYIHEHLAQPLTVTRIAEAAGLSTRSMQESFQRTLGLTPMGYLAQARLGHTHTDLLTAEPGTTTVAAIARRWGFLHHGRFAGTYHQQYGESPRETLRRSR